MEGGFTERTPQPGQDMFPTHETEVRDARHGEASEGQPPSASGDRPSKRENDPGLIARPKRPSFLQLLSALWGAEEELEQRKGTAPQDQERPQTEDQTEEEKP